jgi:hypothetical protein
MSQSRVLKNITDGREIDRNTALCPVRPAELHSDELGQVFQLAIWKQTQVRKLAPHFSAGFETRWAHRLQVYVPKSPMLQESARRLLKHLHPRLLPMGEGTTGSVAVERQSTGED